MKTTLSDTPVGADQSGVRRMGHGRSALAISVVLVAIGACGSKPELVVAVPDVTGQRLDVAEGMLNDAGFAHVFAHRVAGGQVIHWNTWAVVDQPEAPGTPLDPDNEVRLEVSPLDNMTTLKLLKADAPVRAEAEKAVARKPAPRPSPTPTPGPDPCTPPAFKVTWARVSGWTTEDPAVVNASAVVDVTATNKSNQKINVSHFSVRVDNWYFVHQTYFDFDEGIQRWTIPGQFGMTLHGLDLDPGESATVRAGQYGDELASRRPVHATFVVSEGLYTFVDDDVNARCLPERVGTVGRKSPPDLRKPSEIEFHDGTTK